MSLTKVGYVDNQTVITADQMNAIQDAIIENEKNIREKTDIHIGTEAPTDENVNVWIDPDEEVEEESSGIDVTAEVGQYIIVKAVDENGKPTEWEAVDRTHYSEWVEILPEQALTHDGIDGFPLPDGFTLVDGATYRVTWNGETYECQTWEIQGVICIGNGTIAELEDTGEPFIIMYQDGAAMAVDYNGTTEVTASVSHLDVVTIPEKYLDLDKIYPYYFDITKAEDGTYSTTVTPNVFTKIIESGRDVICRIAEVVEAGVSVGVEHLQLYSYTKVTVEVFSGVNFAKFKNSDTLVRADLSDDFDSPYTISVS